LFDLKISLDIPILPTVTARITFQDFQFDENIPDTLFEIPCNYEENPDRFPDL
jgi:ankyrin repeat domain-containing protein 13